MTSGRADEEVEGIHLERERLAGRRKEVSLGFLWWAEFN